MYQIILVVMAYGGATLLDKRRAMENACRGAAAGRYVSCQVRSKLLRIVIAIEGSSGIEWEIRRSFTLHFTSR
jgi:hypothetical protein